MYTYNNNIMNTFIDIDNIVIHLHIIDEKYYIRIINVSRIDEYFEEVKNAYGNIINKYDPLIHIFYNCSDLNIRIINDLNYKKFKGVEKIIAITSAMWQIIPKIGEDVIFWYNNIYINWIKSKLNMYLDDLDDDIYFNIGHDIKWKDINIDKYINICFDDYVTNYILLECESTKEDTYIISKIHLLAIVSSYINNNYSKILGIISDSDKNNDNKKSDLIITPCLSLRGIIINKNILSTEDIEYLFKYRLINIDNYLLSSIAKNSNYLELYSHISTEKCNNIYETNIYSNWYSFIENENNNTISNYDIDNVFEINEKVPVKTSIYDKYLFNIIDISNKDKDKAIETSIEKDSLNTNKIEPFFVPSLYVIGDRDHDHTKEIIERDNKGMENIKENNVWFANTTDNDLSNVKNSFISFSHSDSTQIQKITDTITKNIFKNILLDKIYIHVKEFKLLQELVLISNFEYKNEFTNSLIENINNKHITIDIINELKELINILIKIDNNSKTEDVDEIVDIIFKNKSVNKEKDSSPFVSLQRIFTDSYIKIFKNDNIETLASTVIDNIYNYLLTKMSNENINKNQIGTDLVEMGVKKIRKSKGFVYGIEDSTIDINNNNVLCENCHAHFAAGKNILGTIPCKKCSLLNKSKNPLCTVEKEKEKENYPNPFSEKDKEHKTYNIIESIICNKAEHEIHSNYGNGNFKVKVNVPKFEYIKPTVLPNLWL